MIESILSNYWGDSAASLYSSNVSPESFSSTIVYLFRGMFGVPGIYNFLIILGFFTTWIIGFLIIRKEFRNNLVGIFFATLITFAPLRIRYSMEWPTLISWGFCFAMVYFSYKYITRSKISYAILAGLFFCLAFTEHPYSGIILPSVTGISTFIFLLIQKQKKYWINAIILLIILGAFSAPGFYNIFKTREYISGESNYLSLSRSEADRWAYSAKPWNYFVPDIDNPILGDTAVKINYWIWGQTPYYLTEPFFPKEHTLYVGITLFILACFTLYKTYIKKDQAILKYKELTLFFALIGLTAFIFSMPPHAPINGVKIYFPSAIIYQIAPQLRAFARFGILVFIANAALATIGFNYLLNLEINRKIKYTLILLISILVIVEFSTNFFSKSISSIPTTPYKWLAQQPGNFTHLEIPRRTDYTDSLYNVYYDRPIINRYLNTSKQVKEIEDSIIYDIGDSKELICNHFVNSLNGKYIVYHNEDLIKRTIVEDFVKTGKVTPALKIALSESWGQPIWGNHLEKSENDKQKDELRKNLLTKFKNDPRLKQVAEFKQGELDSDPHYNTNDLDAITIFEINSDYCK